mmetsp:Transcript_6394/g.17901  ORF Transcript_6394/g.17901 Transcript_6394/m.17901 type:complete len:226 (+) Transcript_6394:120-797(+)
MREDVVMNVLKFVRGQHDGTWVIIVLQTMIAITNGEVSAVVTSRLLPSTDQEIHRRNLTDVRVPFFAEVPINAWVGNEDEVLVHRGKHVLLTLRPIPDLPGGERNDVGVAQHRPVPPVAVDETAGLPEAPLLEGRQRRLQEPGQVRACCRGLVLVVAEGGPVDATEPERCCKFSPLGCNFRSPYRRRCDDVQQRLVVDNVCVNLCGALLHIDIIDIRGHGLDREP